MLKKTSDIRNDRNISSSGEKTTLLKTTPNIKTPAPPRKTEYKPPVRPVASSHQIPKANQTKPANNRNAFEKKNSGSLNFGSPDVKKKEFSPA